VALRNISLRDFVIVREMNLDVQKGFTVLTGETGAGKSILIDAIQLAAGRPSGQQRHPRRRIPHRNQRRV